MIPNHMNWQHTTLLHDMAWEGDVRKAVLLLDHGADIDAVDAMMAQWQAQSVIDFSRQFTPQQMVIARTIARRELEDHEKHFAEFRRDYFWIDQFPENDRRFPITLAECLEAEA